MKGKKKIILQTVWLRRVKKDIEEQEVPLEALKLL